jgi:hypothetical protein
MFHRIYFELDIKVTILKFSGHQVLKDNCYFPLKIAPKSIPTFTPTRTVALTALLTTSVTGPALAKPAVTASDDILGRLFASRKATSAANTAALYDGAEAASPCSTATPAPIAAAAPIAGRVHVLIL